MVISLDYAYECYMFFNFSTAIGIKCTDGIIMGVEKTLLSKMLVPGTHRRVYAIDRHVGLVRYLSNNPVLLTFYTAKLTLEISLTM